MSFHVYNISSYLTVFDPWDTGRESILIQSLSYGLLVERLTKKGTIK